MRRTRHRVGDSNSAFSQSLKNVRWKFLNEARANKVETIWSQKDRMMNPEGAYNSTGVDTGYQNELDDVGAHSAYNNVASVHLPSKSSGMFLKFSGDEYDRKRLEYVKQLEGALSQSEFPSQILKYLSYEDPNVAPGSEAGQTVGVNDSENRNQLEKLTLQRKQQWEEEEEPLTRETIRKHHEERILREEIEARTNIENMFHEDSNGNLIRKDSMDADANPLDYEDETSDAAFYDDLEESRSPSPIIIWRPAARVKVATDVPPELLQDLLSEEEEEQEVEKSKRKRPANVSRSRRISSFHASHSPKNSDGLLATKSSTLKEVAKSRSPRLNPEMEIKEMSKTGSKIPSSTLAKLKNRPKYKDFKHKYGAWYINPTKWNDCAHGKGEKALTTKGQVTSETERMRQEMSLALDETQKKLGEKIPKLFITEQYRSYLLQKNRQTRADALPLPHYLQRAK